MNTLQRIYGSFHEVAAFTVGCLGTVFVPLGQRTVQLLQCASQKLTSSASPQAQGSLTVSATAIFLYAVYRLSNFFYDVAKLDWHSGKIKKASLELALSLVISIAAISTAVSLIFALLSGLGGQNVR